MRNLRVPEVNDSDVLRPPRYIVSHSVFGTIDSGESTAGVTEIHMQREPPGIYTGPEAASLEMIKSDETERLRRKLDLDDHLTNRQCRQLFSLLLAEVHDTEY